jgi:hypothetical protein
MVNFLKDKQKYKNEIIDSIINTCREMSPKPRVLTNILMAFEGGFQIINRMEMEIKIFFLDLYQI